MATKFSFNSNLNPIFTEPHVLFDFAQKATALKPNSTYLVGFEFDGTACFRKGTKDGPNALREVSDGIESYSPYLNLDLEDVEFFDLGNLSDLGVKVAKNESIEVQNTTKWQVKTDAFVNQFNHIDLVKQGIKILTIGGEHSISYAPITTYLKQNKNLVLLHLDAHADLRDGYEGYHYSHASIIRRVYDYFGPTHQLIQYGIRSGTKDEYQWMHKHESLVASRDAFLTKVKNIDNDTPIYLTLDLDYFDPSFFPGTGTPEPGGEDFHSFVSLCKILREKNFVGCDVVELAPNIDSTGNSSVFAAKVVRELILCMNAGDTINADNE
jgi:agmatinase